MHKSDVTHSQMILKATFNYLTLEIVTACISMIDKWGDDVGIDASCVGNFSQCVYILIDQGGLSHS